MEKIISFIVVLPLMLVMLVGCGSASLFITLAAEADFLEQFLQPVVEVSHED